MLLIKNDLPIDFDIKYFDYIKSLVRSKNPTNKSNIIIVNFSGEDLGSGTQHRDVFSPDEIKIDLVDRVLDGLQLDYIRFLLLLAVDPGVPILPHIHRYPGENESHYQSVVGLAPKKDINAVVINEIPYDLTGHNSVILNVKMDHYVTAQKDPNIWITSFCSRMK
jgi:hypothetical protein